jgi:hypothetical protein
MVHGGARARLDPAHAQRIIAITDEGDRGMIALAACQAYVRGDHTEFGAGPGTGKCRPIQNGRLLSRAALTWLEARQDTHRPIA